jgi:DNA repair photolyase
MKIKTGTKEWADSNVNIAFGCSHNCKYCYAKKMAIRFKRNTNDNWKKMLLNKKAVNKNYKKRKGRIMFPSSHDITEEILDPCLYVLKKILQSENFVLITTKPKMSIIKKICAEFIDYKNFIQFRFTIGSNNSKNLKLWEPGAPTFEERFKCVKFAFKKGFTTSISIEPFLDFDPIPLVEVLTPFVTHTIWIGKMNYIKRNCLDKDEEELYNEIRKNYEFDNIKQIFTKLNSHQKIRWKDSIKKMLSLYN